MAEQNLKISQLAKKATVEGTEMIPVAEGGANYSITPEQIKDYSQPDLSGYAKKSEIPSTAGLLSKTQADEYYQPKGNYQPAGSYATTEQLNGKVSGTGVTSIQVVSALPDPQADGVLYIVTGEEA